MISDELKAELAKPEPEPVEDWYLFVDTAVCPKGTTLHGFDDKWQGQQVSERWGLQVIHFKASRNWVDGKPLLPGCWIEYPNGRIHGGGYHAWRMFYNRTSLSAPPGHALFHGSEAALDVVLDQCAVAAGIAPLSAEPSLAERIAEKREEIAKAVPSDKPGIEAAAALAQADEARAATIAYCSPPPQASNVKPALCGFDALAGTGHQVGRWVAAE